MNSLTLLTVKDNVCIALMGRSVLSIHLGSLLMEKSGVDFSHEACFLQKARMIAGYLR